MEINRKFKLFTMSRPKDIGENYSVSKGLRYKTCNYFHKGVANGCICLHNLITGQVFWKCILKQFCFELIYDKLGTKRCVCSVSTNALRHYVNNGLSYWDFCELRIVIVSNYIISIFHCSVKNFTSAWPPFFFFRWSSFPLFSWSFCFQKIYSKT